MGIVTRRALVVSVSQEEGPCGGRLDDSEASGQPGAIGSYFDLGGVSEGIPEPRGAGEELESQVCAKVSSFDIEVEFRC